MQSAGQLPSFPDRVWKLFQWSLVSWGLITLLCIGLVQCGLGQWVELFNGATWPGLFTDPAGLVPVGPPGTPFSMHVERGFWFFVVLGTRTFINLGIVLSAVPAVLGVYWLITGGLDMLKKQLAAIGRARDLALAAEIIRELSKSGVTLSEEAENLMLKTARGFSDSVMGRRMAEMAEQHLDQTGNKADTEKSLDPAYRTTSRKPYA